VSRRARGRGGFRRCDGHVQRERAQQPRERDKAEQVGQRDGGVKPGRLRACGVVVERCGVARNEHDDAGGLEPQREGDVRTTVVTGLRVGQRGELLRGAEQRRARAPDHEGNGNKARRVRREHA